jgi:hypothetical protein
MLGQYNLLPLLKGWEYKIHNLNRTTVIRGAPSIPLGMSEKGWLLSLQMATTDAYGTLNIAWQGAEAQLISQDYYPEVYRLSGAIESDPSGFVQSYFRPNPISTAGLYTVVVGEMGFNASALPYVPSVSNSIRLPLESTQASASIYSQAFVIAILDDAAFLQSLRLALDASADLGIANELLTVGPPGRFVEPPPSKSEKLLEQILAEMKKR